MIDKNFFKEVQESVKSQILETQLLSEHEKKVLVGYIDKDGNEHESVWKIYAKAQMLLPRVERELYKDNYGATIMFTEAPTEGKLKWTTNENWTLWGYNIPLLGKYAWASFFAQTKELMLGYGVKALIRGLMNYKYAHATWESAKKEYAVPLTSFLKKVGIKSLDEIPANEVYVRYSFNVWEVLQVIE